MHRYTRTTSSSYHARQPERSTTRSRTPSPPSPPSDSPQLGSPPAMTSTTSFSTCLLAGGLAGTAVDTLFFPIDTLKTRAQSQAGFLKAGGFEGVYRGLGSAVVGSAPGGESLPSCYELPRAALVVRPCPDRWSSHVPLQLLRSSRRTRCSRRTFRSSCRHSRTTAELPSCTCSQRAEVKL